LDAEAHRQYLGFRAAALPRAAGLLAAALVAAAPLGAEASFRAGGPRNALTPSERSAGYVLLFNGKDLEGWTGYHGVLPESWRVQAAEGDTFLVNGPGPARNLITRGNAYQDFDLKLEWKCPSQGSSGIFIRYLEIETWGGASGPEAEINGPLHFDAQQPIHRAGASYDLFAVDSGSRGWARPAGQWNEFRIIAFGRRIAHFGNGRKLLEYEMGSPAWEKAYSESKYFAYPAFREVHPGAIYLEHHGETGIGFRNLRIKVLGSHQDPWAEGSPYRNARGGLIDSLTLEDDLFPTPTGLATDPAASRPAILGVRRGRIHFRASPFSALDIKGRSKAHWQTYGAPQKTLSDLASPE
jgi:hypothetical protein